MPSIVQLVHLDETGDSYYRMRWPARDLALQEPGWTVINLDSASEQRFEYALNADLLVIYQCHDEELLNILTTRKARGLKTIVEYNDNFYDPPPSSPVFNEWCSPLIWCNYEKFMELADTVIVTGPGLQQLFSKKFSNKLVILENHLPEPVLELSELLRRKKQPQAFGWAGSVGHMGDLLAIAPVIKRILERFPESSFHVMGNESIPRELGIPLERLKFTNWGGMSEYYNFLDALQIGIIPVLNTPYNHCRSDIKAIEYSARGILPILTPLTPYKDFIQATNTPTFTSLTELEEQLSKYLSSPDLLNNARNVCHAYVSSARVGLIHLERRDLYKNHLPATEQPAIAGFPAGYHEYYGKAAGRSALHTELMQIQRLKNAGQLAEAGQMAQSLQAQNPHSLQCAYALAYILSQSADPRILPTINNLRQEQPGDLRFNLLAAKLSADHADLQKQWAEILYKLSSSNAHFRKFYERSVCKQFSEQFGNLPQAHTLLQELLKFFPQSFVLRMLAAQLLEKSGNAEAALNYYQSLLAALENAGSFADIEEVQNHLPFIATWAAALKARLTGKL